MTGAHVFDDPGLAALAARFGRHWRACTSRVQGARAWEELSPDEKQGVRDCHPQVPEACLSVACWRPVFTAKKPGA